MNNIKKNLLKEKMADFNDEYAILKQITYNNNQCSIQFECPIRPTLTFKNCLNYLFSNKLQYSAPVYLIEILFFEIKINCDDISNSQLYQKIAVENFEYELDGFDYSDNCTFTVISSYDNILSLNYNKFELFKCAKEIH